MMERHREIETQVIAITPELAAYWLEKNHCDNRKLRKDLVSEYAKDMECGRWILTHQGIAFDREGRLIDGQHRLAAVVKSGAVVQMAVTWNIPKDAFLFLDCGLRRRDSDRNAIAGYSTIYSNTTVIAYAKMALKKFSGGTVVPLSEANEFIKRHEKTYLLLQNFNKTGSDAPFLLACLSAVEQGESAELVNNARRIVAYGIPDDAERDKPLFLYRNWRLMSRSHSKEKFGKACSAIYHYCRNDGVKRISAHEYYELPK